VDFENIIGLTQSNKNQFHSIGNNFISIGVFLNIYLNLLVIHNMIKLR
jgi:hypothetical protein